MTKEKVIVTCGGTREVIDDVRVISNNSTGRLGHEIGKSFARRGLEVTVIRPDEVSEKFGAVDEKINYVKYSDTESLNNALLSQQSPDILIHAPAVSDYRPIRTEGKISSEKDRLTIELEKTPKILPQLRPHFGRATFIAGFKLLSGVPREKLIEVAFDQAESSHLNLTVGNDWQTIIDGEHPLILVTREGGAIDLLGSKENVAANLADFVLKRSRVSWYKAKPSELADGIPNFSEIDPNEQSKFINLLDFAQSTNLLFDKSGNVSMKLGDQIIVSPSQIDKRKVDANDIAVAKVDHDDLSIAFSGRYNPSVDTGISDYLYKKFPNIKYMMHFHKPWGRADVKTDFPFPCGVKEEAFEIESKLSKSNLTDGFVVDLIHHGFLVGLPENGLDRLKSDWKDAWGEYIEHLKEVDGMFSLKEGTFKPIFSGSKIRGVFREHPDGGIGYLQKSEQRGITGPRIIEQIKQRRMPILTVNECGVIDRYKDAYGFTEGGMIDDRIIKLLPPQVSGSDEIFRRIDEWRIPYE